MRKELSWEERIRLPEVLWLKILEVLPKFKHGRPSHQTKNFIEAILFRFRTGISWRDLPPDFGPWKNTYNRFNRWVKKGYFLIIFEFFKKHRQQRIPYRQYGCSAHQHAAGAIGGQSQQCLGRSVGAFTSKVHLCSSSDGHPDRARDRIMIQLKPLI